jgi:hypothetical protein
MQARSLVKERAQRNLLLVIDGIKTEEMLLANLAGIAAADFAALQALGLIVPVTAYTGRAGFAGVAANRNPAPPAAAPAPAPAPPMTVDVPVEAMPLDYGQFTAALTQIISRELGLRGFVLTLALERAGTIEELQAVAQRTLSQIADRKGAAVAAAARRALYGG